MLTHAGSVTYCQNRDETLYLIISSSDGSHWVLPKGHIESDESPEAAALRELREEAGVVGEIAGRLQIQSFEMPGEKVTVQYYLIKALEFCPANETRVISKEVAESNGGLELEFCPANETRVIRWENQMAALALVSFENSREVLLEGIARVQKLSRSASMQNSPKG